MKANLINSYEIETDFGVKSIEIHNADITSFYKPFDILLISAHSYHYKPSYKTVIHYLSKKDINISELSKTPEIDLRESLNIWLSEPINKYSCNFNRVACVEFGKNLNIESFLNPLVPFFSLIEKLEIDIKALAMPLLGTGCSNLPIESILELELKSCEKLLKNIKSLDKIYLIEKDISKSQQLDENLNKYLNRSEIIIKDIFLDPYNSEVLEKLESNITNLLKIKKISNSEINYEALIDFNIQIKRRTLRYFELCASARKIVELLLKEQLGTSNNGLNLISSIDLYLKKTKVSTWITSYMHVIRVLTNNQIHYSQSERIPNEIKNQDQRILLSCLYQITDYWIQIS